MVLKHSDLSFFFLYDQAYDFDEYLSAVESKNLCDEETTTAPASAVTVGNTQEDDRKTTEQMLNQNTTIPSESIFVTEATNSVSSQNAAADTTTRHSDSSTSSNGIGDIAPTGQPCREIRYPLTNTTLTMDEVEETVEKIIMYLTVNTKELSSHKRSKISAPDDRVSSTVIGMGGIIFIGVTFGLIFVSDIGKLICDLRLAMSDLKSPKI